MKCAPLTLCGSALALLLVGAAAQASPIFNYNWSPDTDKHYATGFGPPTLDHFIAFSNEPPKDASVNPTTHMTTVVATNLRDFSSADDNSPDSINSNYTLTMVLQDLATGHNHSFTFSGNIHGSFSTGTSNIDNSFTAPTSATWTDSNGDKFQVVMNAYTPPGPPDASLLGSIGATVTYSKGGTPPPPPPPSKSPEPSTLLLSFLGLSAVGGRAWWRRLSRTARPAA